MATTQPTTGDAPTSTVHDATPDARVPTALRIALAKWSRGISSVEACPDSFDEPRYAVTTTDKIHVPSGWEATNIYHRGDETVVYVRPEDRR